MYYVRIINPEEPTMLVALMEDYTIDNLIQSFIKQCIKEAGGEDRLLEAFLPDENEETAKFYIQRDNEHIGFMIWMGSQITDRPVLVVKRKDRGDNIYLYSPQGKSQKASTS
jgi:hypothetical protein